MRIVARGAVLVGLIVCCIGTNRAMAQATAQISGTVRDPSNAVLPSVQVRATQTDTGISRMTVTNETGFYVLPSLLLYVFCQKYLTQMTIGGIKG